MAEYIIDKGVSPEVWADIEKLGKALGNMPNVSIGANGSNAQTTSAINAQTEAISKRIKLTIEERVAQQALNQQQKLAATVTSEQTTSLQKLFAQMKLLEIEMQSKFNPALKEQGKEFTNLAAQHAKLQAEYQRTSRATGVMGRQMNSAYGSTFQLTQVMRELPNFAISARIGFMSLSNNLPMLIDSFKILKQQIIDTEGAAGATRKTFAAFGKSLLSLNTIMIVVSTLLVLFGDDIIDYISKITGAAKATDHFNESLSKMQENVFAKMAEDAQKLLKFSLDYYSARKSGDKEVIKSLEEKGTKEFGLHKKQLNMIAENVNNWKFAFNEYLKMAQITYQNEFRIKAGAEAEFGAKRAAAQRTQAEEDLRKYLATKFKDTPGGMTAQERLEFYIKKMKDGGTTGLIGVAGELQDRWALANEEVIKYNKELQELKRITVTAITPTIQQQTGGGSDKTKREQNRDMSYLFPKSIVGEIKKIRIADIPTFTPPINELAIAIDKNLNYAAKAYKDGSISFKEFEEFKTMQFQVAADNRINIEGETQKMLYDLEVQGVNDIMNEVANAESEKLNKRLEIQQAFYDVSMALVDAYYQKYNEKLDKESSKQQKIEDEKLADVEDKEKAKILTKEEAENEKARIAAYYDSVEEEANKKKAELERQQFLISQAFAVADIWIKYAQTVASYTAAEAAMSLSTFGLGAPAAAAIYEPLKAAALFQAGASTALIAAQSIPYFAEGGIMDKNGIAMLGDGGKKELAISPSGKFFISNDTPTMYNLEKGTQILPDVNKLDLMSILALKQVMPQNSSTNDEKLMRELINTVKSQKSGNFYGMPLIKQLDNRSRYSSRNKSLMN